MILFARLTETATAISKRATTAASSALCAKNSIRAENRQQRSVLFSLSSFSPFVSGEMKLWKRERDRNSRVPLTSKVESARGFGDRINDALLRRVGSVIKRKSFIPRSVQWRSSDSPSLRFMDLSSSTRDFPVREASAAEIHLTGPGGRMLRSNRRAAFYRPNYRPFVQSLAFTILEDISRQMALLLEAGFRGNPRHSQTRHRDASPRLIYLLAFGKVCSLLVGEIKDVYHAFISPDIFAKRVARWSPLILFIPSVFVSDWSTSGSLRGHNVVSYSVRCSICKPQTCISFTSGGGLD